MFMNQTCLHMFQTKFFVNKAIQIPNEKIASIGIIACYVSTAHFESKHGLSVYELLRVEHAKAD